MLVADISQISMVVKCVLFVADFSQITIVAKSVLLVADISQITIVAKSVCCFLQTLASVQAWWRSLEPRPTGSAR